MINTIELQLKRIAALDEIARANRFKKAWDAYYGRFVKPLKVKSGQPDDNILVNFIRVVVDKGVSFLFGQDVGFELSETEETAAEKWLDACWRANRKQTLLQKLALNGAVCGHTFVKIVVGQSFPRLVVLDPATVTVRWDIDDIERVMSYRIQYPAVDPQTGKIIAVKQMIERNGQAWKITDQVSRSEGLTWEIVGEVDWSYEWPPIVDCQNLPAPNEYWGISDLEDDVLQLNHAINFVLSNLARIIRYHAHPKTWGRGFTANQLNIAVDETIVLPSSDAELKNLEMISDLSSSIAVYERLREALHEVTRVPEVATGKLDRVGTLSGVALNILYQPLLEKTETKRRTYGDLLVELNRRLLALGGFGENNKTVLHWPELLPGDPKAEAETAVLHQQLGVSQDTLLEKLGYDPELEAQKREVTTQSLGEQLLTAFDRGTDSLKDTSAYLGQNIEEINDLKGAQDPFVYLIHHIHHVPAQGSGTASVSEELHHCPLFVSPDAEGDAYHVDDMRDGNKVLHVLIDVRENETPPETLYDHLGNAYRIVLTTVEGRRVWVVAGLKKGQKVKWSDAEAR